MNTTYNKRGEIMTGVMVKRIRQEMEITLCQAKADGNAVVVLAVRNFLEGMSGLAHTDTMVLAELFMAFAEEVQEATEKGVTR